MVVVVVMMIMVVMVMVVPPVVMVVVIGQLRLRLFPDALFGGAGRIRSLRQLQQIERIRDGFEQFRKGLRLRDPRRIEGRTGVGLCSVQRNQGRHRPHETQQLRIHVFHLP